jgi:para-aminobenzoate synthetase component 1
MLLHSGHADHPHNRYDILVADPITTLTTRAEQTIVHDKDGITNTIDDPMTVLRSVLTSLDIQPDYNPNLPFQGGALGLFGYDLGRRFESLPNTAERDISLPDMAIGIYDWALIVDHQLKTVSLLSHTDVQARLNWLENQSASTHKPFALTSAWQSNMSREQYGEKFRQVQRYLHSGDCYQVNLAQRFQAQYQGDEWLAFMRLNHTNRAPFSAFIRLEEGAILSLSPERFIQLENQQIQTRPIKGTLPRLDSPDADRLQAQTLANSPKDRAENLMIVDLMRNDIGRVAVPGSVKVPELFVVEPFPAVHHLVSTITARLPETLHATDLLRAAFPGGSITGAPKVRAMEIIDELEPQRRNAWCGSIGYLSFCGNMDTSITIRTLTAVDGQIYCSAGGGIVADSQEYAEYQETFDKVNRILHQLEN